jgi:hypothetical protein
MRMNGRCSLFRRHLTKPCKFHERRSVLVGIKNLIYCEYYQGQYSLVKLISLLPSISLSTYAFEVNTLAGLRARQINVLFYRTYES